MNEELEALLLTEGLINVRGHRHLARRVAREVGRETLVRLLPGIYAAPKDAHDFQVRAKALALADPNAIFVRHTAARLTWWEELSVPREKLHYLDIAFPELRLNFELDGWEFHSGYSSFVEDRRRDVNLSKAGWSVLRFTDPSVDELVEAATVMIPRRRHELRLG